MLGHQVTAAAGHRAAAEAVAPAVAGPGEPPARTLGRMCVWSLTTAMGAPRAAHWPAHTAAGWGGCAVPPGEALQGVIW